MKLLNLMIAILTPHELAFIKGQISIKSSTTAKGIDDPLIKNKLRKYAKINL